jgi:hypothetical protein
MTMAWAAIAVIAAVAALVSAGVSFELLRRVRRMADRERVLEGQLSLVDEAVCAIEARLGGEAVADERAGEGRSSAAAEAEREGMRGESIDAEIAPEIQAAIAAAAVVAAGERVRVHAMRLVKSEAERNAWSQQGRVLVQTSHNVRARR